MVLFDPDAVSRVACVGAGVIGGGWAAYFLAIGYEVTAYSPFPAEEDKLRRVINVAWPSLIELGVVDDSSPDRICFTTDLQAAVAKADFVQESAPEEMALKQQLYAEMSKIVPPNVVIASSTSGLSLSDIQLYCGTPGRTVVGHPYNPPYLMPLVEVVGGERTDPEVIEWAVTFSVTLRRSIYGWTPTTLKAQRL